MDEGRHEWLKVPEVAEVLRIARGGAYELVRSGEIPSVKIGRSVRVSLRELERWLDEQRQPSAGRVQTVREFPGLQSFAV